MDARAIFKKHNTCEAQESAVLDLSQDYKYAKMYM